MADVRELDQIQIEIERLHERSQNNKAEIQSHEAVCEERYNSIVTMFQRLENRLDKIDSEVDSIKVVATSGRASLKTLLWVGGLTAGIISLIAMIIPLFPK